MAITDIDAYAPDEADVETLGAEFDAIRRDIEAARGEEDARYIRRAITIQRSLVAGGRVVLLLSNRRPLWLLGTALLGAGKIIENMELGHNVMHGQWNWLNDPGALDHLGMGQHLPVGAVEAFAQLRPPQVHQRRRDGR